MTSFIGWIECCLPQLQLLLVLMCIYWKLLSCWCIAYIAVAPTLLHMSWSVFCWCCQPQIYSNANLVVHVICLLGLLAAGCLCYFATLLGKCGITRSLDVNCQERHPGMRILAHMSKGKCAVTRRAPKLAEQGSWHRTQKTCACGLQTCQYHCRALRWTRTNSIIHAIANLHYSYSDYSTIAGVGALELLKQSVSFLVGCASPRL